MTLERKLAVRQMFHESRFRLIEGRPFQKWSGRILFILLLLGSKIGGKHGGELNEGS